ncbi:response regulator transcription factor [Seleniivibrio woodruffii]|uniref:response regulator transcription factor n=1 Tax=Seleniivibrio woodruffii TaxID=1078050 RepID=UPI0024099AE0|nr:response regulator transcription factor [Seleniivibrio woodruffii]
MLELLSENMCLRLLLIEDDYDLAESIIDFMESRDCSADFAASGKQALSLLKDNIYDVIALNINLGRRNGFDICSNIRQVLRLRIPVVILTEGGGVSDILNGLRCGADDYISKPFSPDDLFVRVQAVLERQKRQKRQSIADVFKVGDLTLDPEKGIVRRGEQNIRLSSVCFRILLRLVEKSPGFVSREELEYDLWRDQPPMTNALKAHFWTLRTRVDKPFNKQLLYTMRGRGYKIEDVI